MLADGRIWLSHMSGPAEGDNPMIKYYYPDGSHCFRALHTAHAVFFNDEGQMIARAMRPDNSGLYEFEITGFELLEPGVCCS